MTDFPQPPATSPDAVLSLRPSTLTEEQGWHRSMVLTGLFTNVEVWYHYHGTILRVDRPIHGPQEASWRSRVVEHMAWKAEPNATGARNTERIFEAERWTWEAHVTFMRNL